MVITTFNFSQNIGLGYKISTYILRISLDTDNKVKYCKYYLKLSKVFEKNKHVSMLFYFAFFHLLFFPFALFSYYLLKYNLYAFSCPPFPRKKFHHNVLLFWYTIRGFRTGVPSAPRLPQPKSALPWGRTPQNSETFRFLNPGATDVRVPSHRIIL